MVTTQPRGGMEQQLALLIGMWSFREVYAMGPRREGLVCLEETGRVAWKRGHLIHGTIFLSL